MNASARAGNLYERIVRERRQRRTSGDGGAGADAMEGLFEVFVDWVGERGFELYPAQEEAILEILSDRHVILKTPTGSGKSLVAVAHIALALACGRRAVYTSPIKALVNEKFLDMCDIFGPAQVGMMTGDSAVNRDAPVICCTAEILAKMALREGDKADAHYVVMDEFHYFADPERGWAWQVPLLVLGGATFLLMSATLGDTRGIEARLEALTGKAAVSVSSAVRPVPLDFEYSEEPLHDAVANRARGAKAPIYLVNFTQREAADEAQKLMSQDFTPKEDKKRLSEELPARLFDTPYGKEMQRFLRHGIGLHHGGLLPKYRLMVEKLARAGLLRVISGTDTLGVGVNIPIRTVLFTKLCKFDGTKTRLLSVREFKQIAGRAGRKGYDDRGFVVAQAPEHVIENRRLEQLAQIASAQGGKKKKVQKKQPPTKGYVAWSHETFEQLVQGQPEALESRFDVTHGMLVELMQRPDNPYVRGGGLRRMVELIAASHESPYGKKLLRRKVRELFKSLVKADILALRASEYFRGREVYVAENLQTDFSLMHALGLFLVEAIGTLAPEHAEYALDAVSFVEAILEEPKAILLRQLDKKKGELIAEWKAAGIEYDERMRRLEEVTWDKPKADVLYDLFDRFAESHPWVGDMNVKPKSVMRDIAERYMSFNEYVKELGLERIEGTLLRYLSEGFKTLVHTVPVDARSDELVDLIAFYRTVLGRVDTSLIQEWERLMYGEEGAGELEAAPVLDITRDRRAFAARVRAELHALVKALAAEDLEEAAASVRQLEDDPWPAARFAEALAPLREDGGRVVFDHRARLADKTRLVKEGPHEFVVHQVLVVARPGAALADAFEVEPEEDDGRDGASDWMIEGRIDLREDTAPEGPMIALVRIEG